VRHVEGRPKSVASTIETQIARLVTADSALDFLRKHDAEQNKMAYDMLAGAMGVMSGYGVSE